MKRLGTMERVGLVLAAVFVAFGVYSIIHRTQGYVPHPGSGRYQSIIGHDPPPEHVTKSGARIYGFISVALEQVSRGWLSIVHASKLSDMNPSPNKITGANAGGPPPLPLGTRWAARIAQFCRSV